MIESAKAGRRKGLPVVQKDAQEDGILNLFPETADNLIMLFPTESTAPPPGQWNGSTVHFLTFSTIESRADRPTNHPPTIHHKSRRRNIVCYYVVEGMEEKKGKNRDRQLSLPMDSM